MRTLLSIGVLLCALPAYGQSVCDVTYTTVVTLTDGTKVAGPASLPLFALPMADVLDNSKQGRAVLLNAVSKEDKAVKGNTPGPYTVSVAETRACDGGTPSPADAAEAQGVTLQGLNRIGRASLKLQDYILKRYESRAAAGQKTGWDHSKAKKQ